MAKTQENRPEPLISPTSKSLQKALRLAAKNANRMANVFGLKVPVEKNVPVQK